MERNNTITTELALIKTVGEWSDKNFGFYRKPELGVVEEVGEAVHCLLKRLQGIRGFENREFFVEHFADALADTVIFLSDWCSLHNAYFQFSRCQIDVVPKLEVILQHLLQGTSALFSDYAMDLKQGETNPIYSSVAQRILQGLMFLAKMEELDLSLIVAATWLKVSRRNWKANPVDADCK